MTRPSDLSPEECADLLAEGRKLQDALLPAVREMQRTSDAYLTKFFCCEVCERYKTCGNDCGSCDSSYDMDALLIHERVKKLNHPFPQFEAFPKIPRLRRTIIVTEKIDGTNAQICITEDGVFAGSRNRWITPDSDNMGFACWVEKNKEQLRDELGFGTHFGEWWGAGIQRRYGQLEKHFSLFNTHRWKDAASLKLCKVVPTLYIGDYSDAAIQDCLDKLKTQGSLAAPGFMNPEGVVVYMTASGSMHKVLLEHDELPKGKVTHQEKLVTFPGNPGPV